MAKTVGKKMKNEAQQAGESKGWPPPNRNAAGIGVGSAADSVAVSVRCDAEPVREFGRFTTDLRRMPHWLKACQAGTVVIHATGVDWAALYDVLEGYGLKVNVVNARRTKTPPGRKTDGVECRWLQRFRAFGLLNNSFRPAEEVGVLPSYLRQR
jgi:transposase